MGKVFKMSFRTNAELETGNSVWFRSYDDFQTIESYWVAKNEALNGPIKLFSLKFRNVGTVCCYFPKYTSTSRLHFRRLRHVEHLHNGPRLPVRAIAQELEQQQRGNRCHARNGQTWRDSNRRRDRVFGVVGLRQRKWPIRIAFPDRLYPTPSSGLVQSNLTPITYN